MRKLPKLTLVATGLGAAALAASALSGTAGAADSANAAAPSANGATYVSSLATDAAYVWESRPTEALVRKSRGTSAIADIKGGTSDRRRAYYKYNVNIPAGMSVSCAQFGVQGADYANYTEGPLDIEVYGTTSSSWTGSRTTWQNRPGFVAGTKQREIGRPGEMAIDVTALVRAHRGGALSVGLTKKLATVTPIWSQDPGYDWGADRPALTVAVRPTGQTARESDCVSSAATDRDWGDPYANINLNKGDDDRWSYNIWTQQWSFHEWEPGCNWAYAGNHAYKWDCSRWNQWVARDKVLYP